jgi:hypothetical protein
MRERLKQLFLFFAKRDKRNALIRQGNIRLTVAVKLLHTELE